MVWHDIAMLHFTLWLLTSHSAHSRPSPMLYFCLYYFAAGLPAYYTLDTMLPGCSATISGLPVPSL